MPSSSTALLPALKFDPRSWVERLWSSIADRGQPYAEVPAETIPPLERARQLTRALLSERGEASGAAVARELLAVVRELPPEERVEFYRFLAAGFVPDEEKLRAAAEAYLADPSAEQAASLAQAAEPTRQEVLRRMNLAPGGTASLVAMRRELAAHLREEPQLRLLDFDLRHLFISWFNRGFLELRSIDWQTPAAVLEKLIAYEAVHEIQGWDDLRRRLAADRRCFAFFHPALRGEPLIFVEVALVEGLAGSVQTLLMRDADEAAQRERAARADTAIFYSISNCQEGLRGISFGNFLIKQVVEELKAELPNLVRFSTLSPVPGFRRWLETQLAAEEGRETLLREDERAAVLAAAEAAGVRQDDPVDALRVLSEQENWWERPEIAEALRKPLVRLCALYLTTTGRRGPLDPVGRFHLGNGARLERINWLGNTARRGIRESYGLMVNYLYDPDTIEANHERFVRGNVVRSAAVDAILGLPTETAQPARPARGRKQSA